MRRFFASSLPTVLIAAVPWAAVPWAAATWAVASPVSAQDKKVEGEDFLDIPTIFSDHMVLQRETAVPFWGWATAGNEISVTLVLEAKKDAETKKVWTATTRTGNDGRWALEVKEVPAGGPYQVTIEGARIIKISDVLVGEVWLGSGQSNMNWRVKRASNYAEEKPAATFPQIRMFTVTQATATTPQEKCAGTWKVCSPDTVGDFSATAYFFGRKLHRDLDVPVGLIHSSWGGTAIEAWTSMDAQAGVAELEAVLAPWNKARAEWNPAAAKKTYEQKLAEWTPRAEKARAAKERVPAMPQMPKDPAKNQNHPATLFNGMISPLIPYAIRGAIWYQGERNARGLPAARRYRVQMPLMIRDWRKRWGRGDFPFGFVQLPNFKKRTGDPATTTAWAMIRESMLKTLAVRNTGMAVTIDVGEANDIHPKNKQAVGLRLASWALATVYDREDASCCPVVASSIEDGTNVVFRYKHAAGGMKTSDGKSVRGFAIAGSDRNWYAAQASVEGDRVKIWHPAVPKPMAVRYAWGDNPDCNLVNGVGFPASPFRTDRWEK